jgi:phosphohistidine phosphatase SixA
MDILGSLRREPALQRSRVEWAARCLALGLVFAASLARAEPISGADLATALRQGGFVLVMRHASAPATPPAASDAEPDNRQLERQLDSAGRTGAQLIGAAIKSLRLPIDDVWSSPTYRARETVRMADLPAPEIAAQLGDGGQSMQAASAEGTAWLRAKVAEHPRAATNRIIVTQLPNINAAFGPFSPSLADGETLVFRPGGKGNAQLVARIRIEDWPALATKSPK